MREKSRKESLMVKVVFQEMINLFLKGNLKMAASQKVYFLIFWEYLSSADSTKIDFTRE